MKDQFAWKMLATDYEFPLLQFFIRHINPFVKSIKKGFDQFTPGNEEYNFEDAANALNRNDKAGILATLKFVLLSWILRFLFLQGYQEATERIAFILITIYICFKIWHISTNTNSVFMQFGSIEILVYLLYFNLRHHDQSIYCVATNIGLLFMLPSTCINCYINFGIGIAYVVLHIFLVDITGNMRAALIPSILMYISYIFILNQKRNSFKNLLNNFNKTIENSQQDVQIMNQYIASIANDLKNPLQFILNDLDNLKASSNINQAERKSLQFAAASGQLLIYLIGNIVDASKLKCGCFEIEKNPIKILKIVNKVIGIEKEIAKLKKIKLFTKVVRKMPKIIIGDSMRIMQVLTKLISNSIKITQKGYVALIIDWAENASDIREIQANIPQDENIFSSDERSEKEGFSECDVGSDNNDYYVGKIAQQMSKYSLHSLSDKGSRTRRQEEVKSMRVIVPQLMSPNKLFQNNRSSESDDENDQENTHDYASNSGILIFDIIDSAVGMYKEKAEPPFQHLSKPNRNLRRSSSGVDFGLQITQKIVESMGGIMECNSLQQQGTVFRVRIPCEICHIENKNRKILPHLKKTDSAQMTEPATIIRRKRKYSFGGDTHSLDEIKLIVLEDQKKFVDWKLQQMHQLLSKIKCEVFYSTYDLAISVLQEENYSFHAILIFASSEDEDANQTISSITKRLEEEKIQPIPYAIEKDKSTTVESLKESQFRRDMSNDFHFSFPLEDDPFFSMIYKLKAELHC